MLDKSEEILDELKALNERLERLDAHVADLDRTTKRTEPKVDALASRFLSIAELAKLGIE